MPELARLRRRIRLLMVLVVGLSVLSGYAWFRPAPDMEASVIPASEEEVEALKGRLVRASYRERVRMLHGMTRGGWGGRAEEAVIQMLHSARSDRERLLAIDQLGRVGSAAAVSELAGLTGDGKLQVRRAAVIALGRIGGDLAVAELSAILEQGDRRVVSYAVSSLGEAGGGEAVDLLIKMAKDPRGPNRRDAILALGQTGADGAFEVLDKLLGETSAPVQRNAVSALGSLGTPAARTRLMALAQEGSRQLRLDAVSALGEYSGDGVAILLASLAKSSDAELAGAALRTLGQVGGPLAEQALLAAAGGDNPGLRDAALSALGDSGSPAAEKALLSALKRNHDPHSTVYALSGLGTPEAKSALLDALRTGTQQTQVAVLNVLEGLGGEEVDRVLGELVAGSPPRVAAEALSQLATRQGKAAIPSLLRAYREGGNDVKYSALNSLVELKGPGVDKLLLEAATSGNYQLNSLAVETLARRGGPRAVQVISRLYTDGPAASRNNAAYALAQMGGDEARRVLLSAVRTDEDNSHAIWALGQMKDAESMNALTRMLDDSTVSDGSRQQVVSALASAGRTDDILRAASHPDKAVSVAALESLGTMGGKEAERTLLSAMNSRNDTARDAALRSLGQIGTPRAVDTMIASLDDKKLADRAAGLLVNIGGKKVSDALSSAYQRGDTNMRRTIVQNLSYQPGPDSRRLLMSALNESDDQLVSSAAQALGRLGDANANSRLLAMMQSTSSSKMVRHAIASSLRWGDQRSYRTYKTQIDQAIEAGAY